MTPGVEWSDEPPFNADYHFCTFADGNGFDELRPVMANFDAWVDGREKDSMWYVWHDPLFDTSGVEMDLLKMDMTMQLAFIGKIMMKEKLVIVIM